MEIDIYDDSNRSYMIYVLSSDEVCAYASDMINIYPKYIFKVNSYLTRAPQLYTSNKLINWSNVKYYYLSNKVTEINLKLHFP